MKPRSKIIVGGCIAAMAAMAAALILPQLKHREDTLPGGFVSLNYNWQAVLATAPSVEPASVNGWPGVPYAKVLGFRFSDKADKLHVIDELNGPVLKDYTESAHGLDAAQVKRLLNATVNSPKVASPMACYDPHHAFVFFSETGAPVAAVEICFICNGSQIWPYIDRQHHADFGELAKLANANGLWSDRHWDSLDHYLTALAKSESASDSN